MKKRFWDKVKEFIGNDFAIIVMVAAFITIMFTILVQIVFDVMGV